MYTDSILMAPRDLGRRIKHRRVESGLTQLALASKAKVSRVYISKLEAGERQAPSLAVLERLAKVLGVRLADLVDPVGSRKRRR